MASKVFKIGGGGTDTPADVKCMAATPGSTQYMTFESPVGTDYQVPSGKIFYITKIIYSSSSSAALTAFQIGYGDTGVPAQAGAPTNAVNVTSMFATVTNSQQYTLDVFIPIPAQKYPYILTQGNGGPCTIFGIEV